MSTERCENCKFWLDDRSPKYPDIDEGYCRCHPPQPALFHLITCAVLDSKDGGNRVKPGSSEHFDGVGTGWNPKTPHDEWCGEWQAKPGTVPLPVANEKAKQTVDVATDSPLVLIATLYSARRSGDLALERLVRRRLNAKGINITFGNDATAASDSKAENA